MHQELTISDGTFSNQALRTELRVFDCSLQKRNCELRCCRRALIVRQAIFESFEPESSEEEDSEAEGEIIGLSRATNRLKMGEDDEADEPPGTGVLTSQLRHFVIQVRDHNREISSTSTDRAGVPA
jgi:hypothetical protein